jgi:hypothetical protein
VSANATAVVDFLQLTNMVRYTTGWRRAGTIGGPA